MALYESKKRLNELGFIVEGPIPDWSQERPAWPYLVIDEQDPERWTRTFNESELACLAEAADHKEVLKRALDIVSRPPNPLGRK